MKQYQLDLEKYKSLARQAAAEGCVLLLNENKTLPFQKGETVSIFGRSQMNYYKSGTGSGGMVNVDYSIGITEGLINSEEVLVNKELLEIYSEWVKEHPFDIGMGWAQEPWFQEEMPLSDNLLQDASKKSDTAIVILGRTAGEDRDNTATEGSYYLTAQEKSMLEQVRRNFTKMVVVLNVGNIIDMGWMDEYKPDAVIYVWQGGQEGGNGVADVLTGKVNPCGKLTDTIAYNLTDYPSYHNYGDEKVNFYEEDIYVGYRYFETVAKDKVKYPFGFGLSYTSFELDVKKQSELTYEITVTNIGDIPGKEVVQIYVQAPQGLLGKPSRVLVDFGKTGLLKPKESETLRFTIDQNRFASYDDSGCTGYKSCYVLEAGEYSIYIGSDVKSAVLADCYTLQNLIVTEKLSEAMAPVEHFDRMKIKKHNEGEFSLEKEKVPTRTNVLSDRIIHNRPSDYPYTGDQGYKLADVLNNKTSMENFIAQLSNEDLACIIRGEGMCSPKVTPGTAGAYGGVTEELKNYGIPIGCCADGPSGIRMDCGTKAFSLPNGTLLACTFNRKLNEDLFEMLGIELGKHRIEALLGPGINIHRNPLNGRNFEYFSEDPYLTGQIAAAQLKGLHRQGTTGVIKHFCGNNQEFHRMDCNSVISERALREIYLKGFEIAVKEGGAHYVMTSYNPVNGIWCAGNYDLNTTILREEWGFHGIVMTDWWAQINEEGESQSRQNTACMVRAQNDLYMVVSDSKTNSHQDNTMEMLEKGAITRGDLQRSAANICHALMFSNAMDRMMYPENYINSDDSGSQGDTLFAEDIKYYDIDNGSVINLSSVDTTKGSTAVFGVHILKKGEYKVYITVSSEASEIAQMPFTLFLGGHPVATLTVVGTSGKEVVMERNIMMFGENSYLKFYFGQSGIVLSDIKFELVKEFSPF
jgi:beta-glucosidase